MKDFSSLTKEWKTLLEKNRKSLGVFSVLAFIILMLGVSIGWTLSTSAHQGRLISFSDWIGRYGTLLELLSAFALLIVTAVYVLFTYRQSRSSERQVEASVEELELARKQLELLRSQLEIETRPKIFIAFETIDGKTKFMEEVGDPDIVIAINNFSRHPVLIDYVTYKLPEGDFYITPQLRLAEEVSSLGHQQIPKYGVQRVPKFFDVAGKDYWLIMFFYYGATGGVRYRYAVRIDGGSFHEVRAERLDINVGLKQRFFEADVNLP